MAIIHHARFLCGLFLCSSNAAFSHSLVLCQYDLEKLKSGPHKCEKNPKAVDQSSAAKELDVRKEEVSENGGTEGFKARPFTFAQLVAATENFKSEYFLGEGGFGKVHRGKLVDTGQVGCYVYILEVLTMAILVGTLPSGR